MYGTLKGIVRRNSCMLSLVVAARRLRRAAFSPGRSRNIRKYLATHQIRKLQLGAGPNVLEGWLNTDLDPRSSGVLFLDSSKPFSFSDFGFDYIFSEHHLERLEYHRGLFTLRECYRVLKPGVRIRIATPSLDTMIALHTKDKTSLQEQYIEWITKHILPEIDEYRDCFVINKAFYGYEHRFLYDEETLRQALEKAGFVDITRFEVGESDNENLRGIETHGRAVDNESMNRFETMVLEAARPSIE